MRLAEAEVARLLAPAARSRSAVTIELAQQSVTAGGWATTFQIDPFVKHCLLNDLDDVALIAQHESEIAGYERRRPAWRPVTV